MAVLIGDQLPRLESVPPYYDTRAPDALALGETAGLFLDPWQKHVMTGALGVDRSGMWTSFEVKILVSRQNGKGSILEVRELAGLYLFSTDRLMIHTAHEHKTSAEHFMRVWGLIEHNDNLRRKVQRHSSAYGREFIEIKPEPTIIFGAGGRQVKRKETNRLLFIARTGGSGRGFTGDYIDYDEDMILDSGKVGASLPSLLARPNPQVWYTGSAGMRTSSQLALIRRRGVAAAERGVPEEGLCFYEWSIDAHNEYCPADCTQHDDATSDRSVAKANPGLGIRLSLSRVRKLEAGMAEEERQREIYGVGTYPAPLDGWLVVPKKWWEATADSATDPPRVTRPVFAIDVALDRSSAAIAVAGLRPDNFVGVQVAEHHEGTGWLVKTVKRMDAEWHPACWIIDKRSAAGSLIADLEAAGITVQVMQAVDVAHASGQLYDAFRDDTLRHFDQASVRTGMAAVDWRKLSESRAIDRVAAVDTAPLMAFTFAHWGYLRFGMDDYDTSESLDTSAIMRACLEGAYGPADIRRLVERQLLTEKDLETLKNAGIYF